MKIDSELLKGNRQNYIYVGFLNAFLNGNESWENWSVSRDLSEPTPHQNSRPAQKFGVCRVESSALDGGKHELHRSPA